MRLPIDGASLRHAPSRTYCRAAHPWQPPAEEERPFNDAE